ncbi:MAG: acyl-CoA dehydrogenase family protein [Actinomycetota bacterium]|nr:acyl-CoA dehydrogenase family protein [Actinomycetota bacterium]
MTDDIAVAVATVADPGASMDALRASMRAWLQANEGALQPYRHEHPGGMTESCAHFRPLQRLLHDAGWTRLGWPVECGGLGGSAVLRAEAMEELAAAGYVIPELQGTIEIIAPMLIRYAPALAAHHVGRSIACDENWCQGFSEPDAGSDLGSLRTRAVACEGPEGDGFRITGQKMWSSYATVAQHCCMLVRTGEAGSGYRGLTMLWVDLDSPGITIRPTDCESGREEVAELFFDDVFVPRDRLIGPEGAGWEVVMFLMQYERGAYAWKRQAELHTQLHELVHDAPAEALAGGPSAAANLSALGNAYLALFALRSQASPTLAALDAGRALGPGISVDKLLLSAAEQTVTDTARQLLWPALEMDDTPAAARWRRRWSFSRITTIYGGAAEVQRDLVAERLLGLPRGR